ncbi:hypothetical protein IGI04_042805, partial [Brassica rapa subsp. trilocularis]
MDLRQKDKEKAKEKEKEVSPGDRTPKVRGKDSLILRPWPDQIPMKDQKWTVVREKHHEDRGHGKMCGKEATGASGAVGQDGAEQTGVLPAGTIPTTVLPALVEQVDNATGLPVGPTLPTEVNETNVDEQQELVHGEDTGSSNVGAGSGQNVDANNVRVTGAEEVIEPTIRGLVEAMQVMGAQIASLTQAFTPLVNSSVGQANPPVRVAAGVTDVGAGRTALSCKATKVRDVGRLAGQFRDEARPPHLVCMSYPRMWMGLGLSKRSMLTGAGGLAQSAGNSWGSAQSSERCVLVRISVGESGTVTGRADGPGAGRFDQMGLRLGIGSGQAPRRMDLRQKDKEKAKEKEKEVAPGDRTPKVRGKDSLILRPWPDPIPMKDQKWTVVREKHHEDRGPGKMCGDWVDSENCVIIVAYCATYDEPHIKLKLLTRRIHQRKPFVVQISDAPTLAETIHGADLSSWNPNPSQQDFSIQIQILRLQLPVQNRASSRSHHRQLEFPINQLAKEATRDPIGGSVRPARVRVLSAHLGGPVSTICKTK